MENKVHEIISQQPLDPATWKPRFFTIWLGQVASLIGSSVVQFGLIWWLTQSTGSATVLATASLIALIPGIFLAPFAGVLVDRWQRRTVMVAADGLVALAALWLAVTFWSGSIEIWHIYALMLLRSIGQSFHWPAMQASTSLMVPDEHLTRVAGLNQATKGALNIVGPPACLDTLRTDPLTEPVVSSPLQEPDCEEVDWDSRPCYSVPI